MACGARALAAGKGAHTHTRTHAHTRTHTHTHTCTCTHTHTHSSPTHARTQPSCGPFRQPSQALTARRAANTVSQLPVTPFTGRSIHRSVARMSSSTPRPCLASTSHALCGALESTARARREHREHPRSPRQVRAHLHWRGRECRHYGGRAGAAPGGRRPGWPARLAGWLSATHPGDTHLRVELRNLPRPRRPGLLAALLAIGWGWGGLRRRRRGGEGGGDCDPVVCLAYALTLPPLSPLSSRASSSRRRMRRRPGASGRRKRKTPARALCACSHRRRSAS